VNQTLRDIDAADLAVEPVNVLIVGVIEMDMMPEGDLRKV